MKNKVLKCIRVRKVVDIGVLILVNIPQVITDVVKVLYIVLLRPYTITQSIAEVVVVCKLWPATMPILITEDMLI